MTQETWWERPDLLSKQLRMLDEAGIAYIKEVRKGILVLKLKYFYEGKELELEATFPELFPYFRFEVKCPSLDLPRHQNPFQKTLCLIGRSTLNWDIDDTLADFIVNRIPNVIKAGTSTSPLPEIEEIQGEPITSYYQYLANCIFLIDSAWVIDNSVKEGTLKIGVLFDDILAVLEVYDSYGKTIAKADERFEHLSKEIINIIWVRSPIIKEWEAGDFKKRLYELHPDYKNKLKRSDFIGVLFQEEVLDRETKDGWVFLYQKYIKTERNGFQPKTEKKAFLVRSGRAGMEDMQVRIPELQFLKNKKIAILGLGCLGAPSAIEFARSGVGEIRILDHDIVEPGTIVRWPLGIDVAGLRKTDAIKAFIEQSYPYTKVNSLHMKIGDPEEPQKEKLKKLIDGVDLIYDATAEYGVQYYFSSQALEKNIPYICVSTTNGAWGGYIARILPGRTGCWVCLKYWQDEESIPVPYKKEDPFVQPTGCAEPTFTGASFDGSQIALAGVRHAVSTLSQGDGAMYPSVDWDVVVINFRDKTGKIISPEYKTFKILKHSKCPCKSPA